MESIFFNFEVVVVALVLTHYTDVEYHNRNCALCYCLTWTGLARNLLPATWQPGL